MTATMPEYGEDLGLFDLADLRELPPLRLPNNLLPLQQAATTLAEVLDLHERYVAERRAYTWEELAEHGRRYCWTPAPAGPKFTSDKLVGAACHPAILSVDLRCYRDHHRPRLDRGEACPCVGDLLYWHWCAGCGHRGGIYASENGAVEDAMDHAWNTPEQTWRDLPILEESMPTDGQRARAGWTEKALAAYPDGWLQAGGPVRTRRQPSSGRHVAHRTPWGGYDLGVVITRVEGGRFDPDPEVRKKRVEAAEAAHQARKAEFEAGKKSRQETADD